MQSFSDATGTSYENINDQRSYRRENRLGSSALNIADVQDLSLATSASSSRLEVSATTKTRQADTALSAALNDVLANTAGSGNATASSTMLSVGKTSTSTTQAQTLRQVSQQLASVLGIKDTSVAQSAIELSLGVGAGSVNEKLSTLLPLKLGASGVQRTSNQIDAAARKAASALQLAGISNVDQVVEGYVRSDVLQCLKKYGQRLDLEIAAEMRLPLATVRSRLAELSATGAVVMRTLTRCEGDKTIEALECRLSGYAPKPAPGRKAQAQQGKGR